LSSGSLAFTFSLAFRETALIDPVAGIYGGAVFPPTGSFSVSELSGRKSVKTSGKIDSGAVSALVRLAGERDGLFESHRTPFPESRLVLLFAQNRPRSTIMN
jgi:hypothetical protein